jgi:hypothetical protein
MILPMNRKFREMHNINDGEMSIQRSEGPHSGRNQEEHTSNVAKRVRLLPQYEYFGETSSAQNDI